MDASARESSAPKPPDRESGRREVRAFRRKQGWRRICRIARLPVQNPSGCSGAETSFWQPGDRPVWIADRVDSAGRSRLRAQRVGAVEADARFVLPGGPRLRARLTVGGGDRWPTRRVGSLPRGAPY